MRPQNITQVNLTSIFNWLKHQLPVSSFIAVKTILSPCCNLIVSSINFICIGGGVYTVNIKLSFPEVFYDLPTFKLLSNNVVVSGSGSYLNGIITFTNVTLTSSTQNFQVTLLTSTSTSGDIGFYQTTPNVLATPPSCV